MKIRTKKFGQSFWKPNFSASCAKISQVNFPRTETFVGDDFSKARVLDKDSKSSASKFKMRALTDVETQTLFSKLANYTGRSLNQLIAPTSSNGETEEDRFVFRLHESRVYYVRLSLANLATSIARESLLSLGTCLGKFTKTGKFRLHITALDVIAPHARYKIWVKPNGEMPFLYGGNVVKAHVGRWSEDCPEHQGVVVLGMDDTPLVRRPLTQLEHRLTSKTRALV
jgi:60S ribosome subunit biogenesis protein NIP7